MDKFIRSRIGKFLAITYLMANAAIASNPPLSANASPTDLSTDYDGQTLLIAKFSLSYVEWPQVTYSEDIKLLNVCVFGDNPGFMKSLTTLKEKVAKRLRLNIVSNATVTDIKSCNIAYIAKGRNDFKDIIAAARSAPVLTVAPIPGFASSGGIMEFGFEETAAGEPLKASGSITFKINYRAASESGIKIATEALSSAQEVIK